MRWNEGNLKEDADGNWVLSSTRRQAQLNAPDQLRGRLCGVRGNGGDTTANSRSIRTYNITTTEELCVASRRSSRGHQSRLRTRWGGECTIGLGSGGSNGTDGTRVQHNQYSKKDEFESSGGAREVGPGRTSGSGKGGGREEKRKRRC